VARFRCKAIPAVRHKGDHIMKGMFAWIIGIPIPIIIVLYLLDVF